MAGIASNRPSTMAKNSPHPQAHNSILFSKQSNVYLLSRFVAFPYKPVYSSKLCSTSNQRLWECVRCRINVYPNTLNDFPSWLSTSKTQPFFINNRGFTERYFSNKVHASVIDWWLRCVTAPVSVDSHVYISFSNFVLNIITMTCHV